MQKRNRLTILIILASWLTSFSSWAQFNKAYFFYKGEELISKGNYSEAIPILNTLLNSDSTIHEGWFLRGVARYYQGDLAGAQRDFSKCLNINPLFSQAYQYRAMALEQAGKSQQALANILKALELRPNSAQYLFTYGVILFQQEKYKDAINAFNRVIIADSRIPDAWLNRGTSKLLLADSTGALNDYSTAINLNPFSPNAYIRRGALYAQQKKYSLALNDLNEAIKLDSTYSQPYFTRALVYYYQNNRNKALADLDKVLKLDTRNTLALFNRAIISYENGNPEEAINDLTRLASIIPTNVLVQYYLANIRSERGYLETALENINKAIELFPQFANAYLLRSEIKSKQGDLAGAATDMQKGRELAKKFKDHEDKSLYSIIDSTGKIKKLLSLNEELDINLLINTEQLKSRIVTITYPLIILKTDIVENTKPIAWQSSMLRKQLETDTDSILLYFDYDNKNTQQKILKHIPQKGTIHHAIYCFQNNRFNDALTEIDSLKQLDSTNTLLKIASVIARIKMAKFVESIRKQSDYHSNNESKSKILSLSTSINELKEIEKENDYEGIIPYNIGVLFMHTGDEHAALTWFTKAIEKNELLHGAWYNRGLANLISNKPEMGCSDLRRAVDLGNEQAAEVVARFCKK